MDVTRCRRNTLYYSTHEWPVYCAIDEIEPFDGHVRCGLFFVKANTGPFQRSGGGWFTEPLVRYGLDKGYLTAEAIEWQLIPSQTLPATSSVSIDALEKAFEDHPDLQKLAVNTFIGLLARRAGETRFSYLSVDASEAAGKFFDNDTGLMPRDQVRPIGDGRDVWKPNSY